MFIFDNETPFWLDVLFFIASWFLLSILFVATFIGIEELFIANRHRKEKKQLQKYLNAAAAERSEQLLFDFDRAKKDSLFLEVERIRNDFDN